MSHLPEPGDVRVAFDRMDARAAATLVEQRPHFHHAGNLTLDAETGAFSGDAVDAFRRAYGDLFLMDELFVDGGHSLVSHGINVFMGGSEDLYSVLASLMMQSMATGVLMERARWERKP
jgi:hypothetical protein